MYFHYCLVLVFASLLLVLLSGGGACWGQGRLRVQGCGVQGLRGLFDSKKSLLRLVLVAVGKVYTLLCWGFDVRGHTP